MRVSFVIPVKNDAMRLRRCLQSINASDYPMDSVEIIVADNGSTDESSEVARTAGAQVLSIPGVRLGELRNLAASAARGDILAFVDADHEIVPEWIPAAAEALRNPSIAAVGAPCRPPSPATWVQRLYDGLRRHPTGTEAADWLGSGNMAVRRNVFIEVGGFDRSLETCEDVDLCRKFHQAGYSIVADPRLRNIHYGDPQTLSHVFLGELWRGRDNVRVSFRAPRSWRTLVSAVIPMAVLASLVAALIGAISASTIGLAVGSIGLLCVLLLVAARAARMTHGWLSRDLPRAFAVAAAYELGRAFALTTRITHSRRQLGTT